MAGYPRKYGLASAIDGFSSGVAQGAAVGMSLAKMRSDENRAVRDEARQNRQEAMSERFDSARISNLEEQTANIRDSRRSSAIKGQVDNAATEAEFEMNRRLFESRKKMMAEDPQNFKKWADGVTASTDILMKTSESWRAAAIALDQGNLEPLKNSDEQSTAAVRKILTDAIGVDIGKVDEVRVSEDGGLEAIAGGKVVGKMDKFSRDNYVEGFRTHSRSNMFMAMENLGKLEALFGKSTEEKDPKTVSLPNGATGLLKKNENGDYAIDEVPVRPVAGGLMSAKPEGSDDGELKDVRVGDEQFTARVKGGKVIPLEKEVPPPRYAWEAASEIVGSGVKTRNRKLQSMGDKDWKLEELVAKANDSKAESKATYNGAIKEWVHGYLEDVLRKAGETAKSESKDGRFSRSRIDEIVVEQMNRDGMSGLMRYLQANPELK